MESLETRLRHWHSLTEQERNVIRDPNDYPLFSVIDGLSLKERKAIYDSIRCHDEFLRDYVKKEKAWMLDFVYYLVENLSKKGLNHDHDAIEKILVEEMSQGATHERFRLYYAAKYRSQVSVPFRINHIFNYFKTKSFLSEIDKAQTIPAYVN